MIHLTLCELLFEILAGGLAHAGVVEHLELEILAIRGEIGLKFAPRTLPLIFVSTPAFFLFFGIFAIPSEKLSACRA